MAAKKTDISQIKDYLDGELDTRAMHRFERQAQDDLFLMDAMDGYQKEGVPAQNIFDGLDSQLQQRIDKGKRGRMVPWRYFAVAASLFIVFSIAYLLPPTDQSPLNKKELTAARMEPAQVDHKAIKSMDTVVKSALKKQLMASVEQPKLNAATDKSITAYKQIAPPQAKADQEIRIDEPAGNTDAKIVAEKPIPAAFNALADRAPKKDSMTLKEVSIPGLAKLTPKDIEANPAGDRQTLQGKVKGVDVTTPQKINGTILNEIGLALPGVNVKLQGTDIGTITDEKGRFSIPANGLATLDIEQSGFMSRRVTAKANDSVKIKLQSAQGMGLAEVVVTKAKVIKAAHPQMGIDAYNRYLKGASISTNGNTGTVRLSFSISGTGVLGDFKIIRGLSNATDQQAINLVKNGPAWVPDASGKTKSIVLRISFSKKQGD